MMIHEIKPPLPYLRVVSGVCLYRIRRWEINLTHFYSKIYFWKYQVFVCIVSSKLLLILRVELVHQSKQFDYFYFFWPCSSYLSTRRAQWIGNRAAGNQLRGVVALPMASLAQHKRSVTYCVVVDGNIVSWRSKKKAVVSRSTIEAEHRAMALALCEMMWLKDLLKKLSGVE